MALYCRDCGRLGARNIQGQYGGGELQNLQKIIDHFVLHKYAQSGILK